MRRRQRDPGRRSGVLGASRRVGALTPRRLAPAVTAGALSSGCGIGLLATSGWLITRAATRPPVFVISVAVGAVQAFALGRGLFRYLQRLSVHDLSLRALGELRLRLYDDVEPLVPGGLPEDGSGGLLNAFVADAELVANGLAQGTTAAVDVVASVVLGVLTAALVAPVLAGVLLVGALAVVLGALATGALARSATARAAQLRAELAEAVVDTVRSARELVAYGRQDLVEERLSSVQRRSMAAAVRQGVASGIGRAATTWLAGGALIAVIATGIAVQRGEHLSGVLLAVVVFAALATFDQISGLPAALADTGAAAAAADRLERLAGRRPPVNEPVGGHSPPQGRLGAALEDAEVAGADGTVLLDGVSVQVGAGRRVALVGPSGAGKTSAVHALLHFVECRRGRATVGGTDVRTMTRHTMADHLGWVAEETHVFAATVGDNLRIARPTASGGECVAALGSVGLGPWLASLPDGLDTPLGAGGRALSAGERQRLGMARALLGGGDVLLLDEPTTHLDPASSAEVLAELLGAAGSRSVLVVSHEPDVDRYVDEVVVLDRGRVVVPSTRPGRSRTRENPRDRASAGSGSGLMMTIGNPVA